MCVHVFIMHYLCKYHLMLLIEDVRIVKQPTSTPVMVGQRLELTCEAEGIPRPKYLWFKGQKPLTDQRVSKLVIENVSLYVVG